MVAAVLSFRPYTHVAERVDGSEEHCLGRPRHPTGAALLAYLMQHAMDKRSENELVYMLSSTKAAASLFRFLDFGERYSKSPHNRVFTRARKELWPLLEDMHTELVRAAIDRGLVKGDIVVLDTVPINLCKGCKRISRCGWVLRGEPVPLWCQGGKYEGARLFHKSEDERMMGWKVGTATDLQSGLSLASVTCHGDVSDGGIGMELLRMLKDRGVRPRLMPMDSAFDRVDVYKFCHRELGAIPVVRLRHNWKARRFAVTLDNGLRVRITPCGTPECPGRRLMRYGGLVWEKGRPAGTVWTCQLGVEEAGTCPGHGGELCEVVLRPEMDWRRICILPRVNGDWEAMYRRRKVGEQAHSQWGMNLGLDRVMHRRFTGVAFHAKLVVLTALLAALLAHDMGLKGVRTMKEVRQRVGEALLSLKVTAMSYCPKAMECIFRNSKGGRYDEEFYGGRGKGPPVAA
jgi:hypothetical protein